MRHLTLSIVFLSQFFILQSPAYSQSYADAVDIVKDAVVNVQATGSRNRPSQDVYDFFLGDLKVDAPVYDSIGSGIILDRKGHILTNYHTIKDSREIHVQTSWSKSIIEAKLVGVDPRNDLAVVKAAIKNIKRTAEFGISKGVRVGDVVLAIGNPFGYGHSVTSGIISAKGRNLGDHRFDHMLQTDAAIHPGNSGGPLIDTRGRVIGINVAIAAKSHGIGFAIPSDIASKVYKQMISQKSVARNWIGLLLSKRQNPVFGLTATQKTRRQQWVVEKVYTGSPAAKAGIEMGDVITDVDGVTLSEVSILEKFAVGSNSFKVKISRKGSDKVFSLKPAERPSYKAVPHNDFLL